MADILTPNDINQIPKVQLQDQMASQNQAPAVPQAQQNNPIFVYPPQMQSQNQVFYAKNQVQPIQYPQLQQPQLYLQQPLLPNQQQQLLQPQTTQKQDPLKHQKLSNAGYMERRHFNMSVLKYFLFFQAFALLLCLCSYRNGFVKLSYNLNGYFKLPFYIFVSVMSLSLLYSYTAHKRLRDKQLRLILVVAYTLSYGFFFQAIYSSTYYYDNSNYYGSHLRTFSGDNEIVIIILCFINLETYSLFSYCMQEVEQLSIKKSFWYIVLPNVTFGGILFSLYYNYDILCIMTVVSCCYGFYLQFTLKRMIESKKFKLRSDDGQFAAVLFSFLLLVPFFDLKSLSNKQQVKKPQSQNSEQKNVQ
ncbi:unnamed protein product (macronuclear) [Paramecium tetraurelia]|uniref:Transmembrane protein n=1 Tax=Paramecium tetraurelia TaxID=5888 RepID=A0CV74_PARTE|nr:uncharacterized protein GSPATT00010859001 [Paramecium tetraurelia]CAK74691.1 unnamed protein product [Paramecium tetraurelia]|eukprot:XP_001442088.1 hypothetical protein (macronuclear) [Paramecium tetraurelia strain d4-2]